MTRLLERWERHHQSPVDVLLEGQRPEPFDPIVGPSGELFAKRSDYIHFEIDDLVRTLHQYAVDRYVTPPWDDVKFRNQGILASAALISDGKFSLGQILAYSPGWEVEEADKAIHTLIEDGFLINVTTDEDPVENFSLTSSQADALESLEKSIE